MSASKSVMDSILFQPNLHEIRSVAREIEEQLSLISVDKTPPGIGKLHECVDVSRRVLSGELSYDEGKAELEDPNYHGFQWKPFSDKQMEILDNGFYTTAEDYYRIILTEGAVRSGKTIGCTAAWLLYLEKHPYPVHLLSGKTKDTIRWNVVMDLEKILGEGYYYYNYQMGVMKFMGKDIRIVGAYDEGSENRIRGMTAGSWYADEVTTYPDNFLQMGLTRASVEGNRIFWTTNPDSPYHTVHTEYMTNEEMLNNYGILVIHFDLGDNKTLPQKFIEDLKRSSIGVFYDRLILGLWTIAEGAIYAMFDKDIHTFKPQKMPYGIYDDYTIGVDYGTASVTCFTLMGVKQRKGTGLFDFHFLDEIYYDAAKTKMPLTDGELAEKMTDGLVREWPGVSRVFLPHDAGSLRTELMRRGYVTIPLMPTVVDELKIIMGLIKNEQLMVSQKCSNIIKQFYTYVWDPKAQEQGLDAPLKINDHAMDSLRYNLIGYITGRRVPTTTPGKVGRRRT